MGRKSKLTEKQWEAVGARLLAGESSRKLGAEFGVAESTIRERFSAQHAEIKTVANQIVATERALGAMPISAQIAAKSHAARLQNLLGNVIGSAEYGAATSHRLQAMANGQVQLIDDADPLNEDGIKRLKAIAVLTKTANEAGMQAMQVIAASKDRMREVEDAPKDVLAELVAHLPD